MVWRLVPCRGVLVPGLYHIRGVLVQWYGGLYHVEFWYNGMEVCTMLGEY